MFNNRHSLVVLTSLASFWILMATAGCGPDDEFTGNFQEAAMARTSVKYENAVKINGPERPYRGDIRFQAFFNIEDERQELTINTIRTDEVGRSRNPCVALYAQNFCLRFDGDTGVKTPLNPLQKDGMVFEFSRGGVAIGTLRYRVDSGITLGPTESGKLIMQYIGTDYDVPVIAGCLQEDGTQVRENEQRCQVPLVERTKVSRRTKVTKTNKGDEDEQR